MSKNSCVIEASYLTNQSLVNRLNLAGYTVTATIEQEILFEDFKTGDRVTRFKISSNGKILIETTTAILFRRTAKKLLNEYKKSSR